MEEELDIQFKVSRADMAWLKARLFDFHEEGSVSSVLHRVQGGKEADVYCCEQETLLDGKRLVAAKIFRERERRSMQNYGRYQDSRDIKSADGHSSRDKRQHKAFRQKTKRGRQFAVASWTGHEYHQLNRLHRAGAKVPKPYVSSDEVILMEYFGTRHWGAPKLHEVRLEKVEVYRLLMAVIAQVALFLSEHCIHGDLSPYNILYWDGDFRIIDLPQAVDPVRNTDGYLLLYRDVEKMCDWGRQFDVMANPNQITEELWQRYQRGGLRRIREHLPQLLPEFPSHSTSPLNP